MTAGSATRCTIATAARLCPELGIAVGTIAQRAGFGQGARSDAADTVGARAGAPRDAPQSAVVRERNDGHSAGRLSGTRCAARTSAAIILRWGPDITVFESSYPLRTPSEA